MKLHPDTLQSKHKWPIIWPTGHRGPCFVGYFARLSEAARLAEIYLKAEIIPSSYRLDSLHVAAASVYKLDCVVSYNFRHINRDKTRILTTNVNNTEGYGGVVICTAKEVLSYEQPDV